MISPFSISSLGIGFGASYVSAIGFKESLSQDVRSGYWRLFLLEMQEESLRKDQEKLKKAVAEAVERSTAPEVLTPKKLKVVLEPLVQLEEFPETRFKRRIIKLAPVLVVPALPAWVAGVARKTEDDVTSLQVLVARHTAAKLVAAANDNDFRLRILLLIA